MDPFVDWHVLMKLKTSKSAMKRIKSSARGKMSRRPTNSGHFNAKDSGAERNKKHGNKNMNASNMKDMEHLFPYGTR